MLASFQNKYTQNACLFRRKTRYKTTTDRPRVMREDVLYIKKSSVIQVQSKGYWNSSRTLATIVLSNNREVLSLPFTFAHLPPRTQPSTPSLSALCAVCKRVGQKTSLHYEIPDKTAKIYSTGDKHWRYQSYLVFII